MSAPALAWKGGRVLITGAGGFVGRHVVRIGRRLGAEMHSLGLTDPGEGVAFHGAQIVDSADVNEVIAKVAPTGIIHLAAAGVSYGQGSEHEIMRVNVEGAGNVIRAALRLASPPAVVCAGSGFEYAPLDRARRESDGLRSDTTYGGSKALATRIAAYHAARLPVTVLRPFSIYGEGEPAGRLAAYVIAKTRAGEPVDLTPGEQLRDYTEVGDVAEAFWRALAQPPPPGPLRVLNIGSGEVITLRAFVETVADVLRAAGFTPDLRFGARPYRSDEMMNYTADISLLRQTLGWAPSTALATGLARMLA
jgi:nucleoside-diphosphate-sugar epimerase